MHNDYKHIETKLIHSGEPVGKYEGAVTLPVFQTSIYEFKGTGEQESLKYIRLNNSPNHVVLHQKLAALENAEAALVTASGMAAISTSLLSVLSAGDHVLVQDGLYGGTYKFVTQEFSDFGLSYDFIDGYDPDSWKDKLQNNTKAVYVESMTNPLLKIIDHRAVIKFTQDHGIASIIDNTFATPVNFRPPEWGYDLSLHSCTKYLNGHSDVVAGAVIGKRTFIEKINRKAIRLGCCLDPHACYLLHRGLKTLAVRIRHQNESALKIAKFLDNHKAVKQVNYPGLESHPRIGLSREFFDGYSGMLSFELVGDLDTTKEFINRVKLPIIAPSLGGIETLLTRPVTTSHRGMSQEEKDRMGISDKLVRISVGLEAAEDIIEDFNQALP
jgi:cystathionine beta-lyase/cystathionine gamma-synthase